MNHLELWRCQVISWATGAVVKQMRPTSKRAAEKVERGVNINLNHGRYETRVVRVCWKCGEELDMIIKVPISTDDEIAEFCSDTCVADFAAREVKADTL